MSCLRTSTSNLVVSPARIIAVTSSLELGRVRAGVKKHDDKKQLYTPDSEVGVADGHLGRVRV